MVPGRPRRLRSVAVAGEEPGEGVGRAAGLGGQDVGGLARGREPDHRSALGRSEPDDVRGGRGLAGAGRADHQDQRSRHRPSPRRPRLRVIDASAGTRSAWLCGPSLQRQLLVEHRRGGEPPVGDVLADRPPVAPVATASGASGRAATHAPRRRAASRSMRGHDLGAGAPAPVGTRVARCRARSARSQVADSSATRRSASTIDLVVARAGGRPGALARRPAVERGRVEPDALGPASAHVSWSAGGVDPVGLGRAGRRRRLAARGRRSCARSGSAPSCSSLHRRISSASLASTCSVRSENDVAHVLRDARSGRPTVRRDRPRRRRVVR